MPTVDRRPELNHSCLYSLFVHPHLVAMNYRRAQPRIVSELVCMCSVLYCLAPGRLIIMASSERGRWHEVGSKRQHKVSREQGIGRSALRYLPWRQSARLSRCHPCSHYMSISLFVPTLLRRLFFTIVKYYTCIEGSECHLRESDYTLSSKRTFTTQSPPPLKPRRRRIPSTKGQTALTR